MQLLKIRDVTRVTGLGRSTIYRRIGRAHFRLRFVFLRGVFDGMRKAWKLGRPRCHERPTITARPRARLGRRRDGL
jgi:hypothetical protein